MPCHIALCACTVDPRPRGRGGRDHPRGVSAHEPAPSLQTVCVCVFSLPYTIKGAHLKS